MLSELHTNGVELAMELRNHIERRLTFALSRFGSRVSKAIIYLTDNNGPKGGIDKSCRIVIRLRGQGDVVAEVEDNEWPAAIDRAAARIGHTVGRELERKRDVRRKVTL